MFFVYLLAILNITVTIIILYQYRKMKYALMVNNLRQKSEIENFVKIITHDIKSPITTIEMYCEVLSNNLKNTSKNTDQNIARILINVVRLRTLIDKICELTLLGTYEIKKQPLDTTKLITCMAHKNKIKNREINISKEIPPVTGDYNLISKLFSIILNNTVKYKTHHPLQVEVYGKSEKKSVVISFKDNCSGIDKIFQDKIFRTCFRLVSNSKVEGAGIGLATAVKIVSLHKGKIWVESEGEGKGSTFHILLPKKD